MIDIDPAKTCCFTGHRPEYLPADYEELYIQLESAIRQAVSEGYDTFLTGMAKGFDMIAGDAVLRLKHRGVPIRLICAVPFKGFAEKVRDEWRDISRTLLAQAEAVEYVCPNSHPGCYQLRNQWMVDRSSRVIAYCVDPDGGTGNTIRYAARKSIPVTNLFDWMEQSISL